MRHKMSKAEMKEVMKEEMHFMALKEASCGDKSAQAFLDREANGPGGVFEDLKDWQTCESCGTQGSHVCYD